MTGSRTARRGRQRKENEMQYRVTICPAEELQTALDKCEAAGFNVRQVFQENSLPARYIVFAQQATRLAKSVVERKKK
jgi:hypothetical protein